MVFLSFQIFKWRTLRTHFESLSRCRACVFPLHGNEFRNIRKCASLCLSKGLWFFIENKYLKLTEPTLLMERQEQNWFGNTQFPLYLKAATDKCAHLGYLANSTADSLSCTASNQEAATRKYLTHFTSVLVNREL